MDGALSQEEINALLNNPGGISNEEVLDPLTDEEINTYIDSNDCYDKAGAYGIQGLASKFIRGVNGDYFNVVGLPISSVYKKILKNQ